LVAGFFADQMQTLTLSMKKYLLFLISVCCFSQLMGQTGSASPPGLSVGDKVPDVLLTNIFNYSSNTAKISDFKDKLLILDFWATWCASCITHFPKMYALQKSETGKVMILLVNSKDTRDTEAGVATFLNKRKSLYSFPYVVMDTALNKLFPHHSLPHYAIVRNNKVVAITDAESINQASIDHLLSDTTFALFVKNDNIFDKAKPLFIDGNGGETPAYSYRTTMTGQVRGLNGYVGFQKGKDGLINRVYAINQTLASLYIIANPSYGEFERSRILYQIENVAAFAEQRNDEPEISNRQFTYESLFPSCDKVAALNIMRADLNRYFKLKIDSEYRDTLCYLLRLNDAKRISIAPAELKAETNIDEVTNAPKYLNNLPVDYLRRELQEFYKIPFIDETKLKDNVILNLPANLMDEATLTESLRKQGIMLTREKRKISYLTLTAKRTSD
jgi:thiol-disulfide isomerase/thioredoxin